MLSLHTFLLLFLKDKKHISRKEAKLSKARASSATSGRRQVTLSTVKSKDVHQDFILDFIKMCMLVDILADKTKKR